MLAVRQLHSFLALTLLIFGLSGCTHLPHDQTGAINQAPGTTSGAVEVATTLQAQLAALAPTVQLDEAQRAAQCAQLYSLELAQEYRLVRLPLVHNLLVNLHWKRRGLCHHWAEDLGAHLLGQNFATIKVRYAVARGGTAREHNAVVLTATDQPFAEGIVLDGWRNSGRLYWSPVRTDHYPWLETTR